MKPLWPPRSQRRPAAGDRSCRSSANRTRNGRTQIRAPIARTFETEGRGARRPARSRSKPWRRGNHRSGVARGRTPARRAADERVSPALTPVAVNVTGDPGEKLRPAAVGGSVQGVGGARGSRQRPESSHGRHAAAGRLRSAGHAAAASSRLCQPTDAHRGRPACPAWAWHLHSRGGARSHCCTGGSPTGGVAAELALTASNGSTGSKRAVGS